MFTFNQYFPPHIRRKIARLFRTRRISCCVLIGFILSLPGMIRWGNGSTFLVGIGAGCAFLLMEEPSSAYGPFVKLQFPVDGFDLQMTDTEEWWESATEVYHGYQNGFILMMPFWPIALFALIRLIQGWNRPEAPPGHCSKCQYDLKSNVSGRCPECGTLISKIREEKAVWLERYDDIQCAIHGATN